MIFSLRHETRHAYAREVDVAAHLVHLTPLQTRWQKVLQIRVTMTPEPSRQVTEPDCFGNSTTWAFLDSPHETFDVVLEAVVDVRQRAALLPEATAPWEDVAAAARNGGTAHLAAEFVYTSPMVTPFPAVRDYAAACFPAERTAFAAVHELTLRIQREFAFRAGVTDVGTPIAKVLAQRAGVCQDFTHLMIAALRSFGLPARYASGYIRTRPPPGGVARRGADQSHAWVSCWLGASTGWVDFDPTNGLIVSDEHVVLAYGRDYSDVSPVSGVILGGGKQTVEVGVDLVPMQKQVAT